MIVWRIRGKIIRTVLCCIVYHNCACWFRFSFSVHVFVFFLNYRASLFVTGLVVVLSFFVYYFDFLQLSVSLHCFGM